MIANVMIVRLGMPLRIHRALRIRVRRFWRRYWLTRSGFGRFGRMAAWLASRHVAPFHEMAGLADLLPHGFVAPGARIAHPNLRLGRHVYLGQGVIIYATAHGGPVELKDHVRIYGNSFIETGMNGRISIGKQTHIQPGCHIHAYLSGVRIGSKVEIAPDCGFYCYDHGMAPGIPIMDQPLSSKGDIHIGDGAWLGHGVIVLQGVEIGEGAVIAAGSVVARDIPANAIAAGAPAKVIRFRGATNA